MNSKNRSERLDWIGDFILRKLENQGFILTLKDLNAGRFAILFTRAVERAPDFGQPEEKETEIPKETEQKEEPEKEEDEPQTEPGPKQNEENYTLVSISLKDLQHLHGDEVVNIHVSCPVKNPGELEGYILRTQFGSLCDIRPIVFNPDDTVKVNLITFTEYVYRLREIEGIIRVDAKLNKDNLINIKTADNLDISSRVEGTRLTLTRPFEDSIFALGANLKTIFEGWNYRIDKHTSNIRGNLVTCYWTTYHWQNSKYVEVSDVKSKPVTCDFNMENPYQNSGVSEWSSSTFNKTATGISHKDHLLLVNRSTGGHLVQGGTYQRKFSLGAAPLVFYGKAIGERSFFKIPSFGPWNGLLPDLSEFQYKTYPKGDDSVEGKVSRELTNLKYSFIKGNDSYEQLHTKNIGIYHPLGKTSALAHGGSEIKLQPGALFCSSAIDFWKLYSQGIQDRCFNHYKEYSDKVGEMQTIGWNLSRNADIELEGYELDKNHVMTPNEAGQRKYSTPDGSHSIRQSWMDICLYWHTGDMQAYDNIRSLAFEQGLAWSSDYYTSSEGTRWNGRYSSAYRFNNATKGAGYHDTGCGREMGWVAVHLSAANQITKGPTLSKNPHFENMRMLAWFIEKATMPENGCVAYLSKGDDSNQAPWDKYGFADNVDCFQTFQLEIVAHGIRCLLKSFSKGSLKDNLQRIVDTSYNFLNTERRVGNKGNTGLPWRVALRQNKLPLTKSLPSGQGGQALKDQHGNLYDLEGQYPFMHAGYASNDANARTPIIEFGNWSIKSLLDHASYDSILENTLDRASNLIGQIQTNNFNL